MCISHKPFDIGRSETNYSWRGILRTVISRRSEEEHAPVVHREISIIVSNELLATTALDLNVCTAPSMVDEDKFISWLTALLR
jgi:hypothetical protein